MKLGKDSKDRDKGEEEAEAMKEQAEWIFKRVARIVKGPGTVVLRLELSQKDSSKRLACILVYSASSSFLGSRVIEVRQQRLERLLFAHL
jgi:hypothetical protein